MRGAKCGKDVKSSTAPTAILTSPHASIVGLLPALPDSPARSLRVLALPFLTVIAGKVLGQNLAVAIPCCAIVCLPGRVPNHAQIRSWNTKR